MRAVALHQAKRPLRWDALELPEPQGHEITIEVEACGVCRTEIAARIMAPHSPRKVIGDNASSTDQIV